MSTNINYSMLYCKGTNNLKNNYSFNRIILIEFFNETNITFQFIVFPNHIQTFCPILQFKIYVKLLNTAGNKFSD